MGSKFLRADIVYAWPTTEIAVMGAEGAVNILYGKRLKDADEPEAERARLVQEYRDKFSTPYTSAAAGYVDDILVPAETRPRLIAALELLHNKQATLPPKKHGNLPL
jgi:propionyl-CoA carboxylase beta chain